MLKNKKEIFRFILIILFIIAIILISTSYIVNEEFRSFIDRYILAKEIEKENATIIELETNTNNYAYAIQNHIVVLSGNSLKLYNTSGREVRKFGCYGFKTNI